MFANRLLAAAAVAVLALSAPALADPVKIVAAENFYGDLATQIGGANVAVTSILTNPDQDPHLFEASAETAKALSRRQNRDRQRRRLRSLDGKAAGRQQGRRRKEIVVAPWLAERPATIRISGTIRPT